MLAQIIVAMVVVAAAVAASYMLISRNAPNKMVDCADGEVLIRGTCQAIRPKALNEQFTVTQSQSRTCRNELAPNVTHELCTMWARNGKCTSHDADEAAFMYRHCELACALENNPVACTVRDVPEIVDTSITSDRIEFKDADVSSVVKNFQEKSTVCVTHNDQRSCSKDEDCAWDNLVGVCTQTVQAYCASLRDCTDDVDHCKLNSKRCVPIKESRCAPDVERYDSQLRSCVPYGQGFPWPHQASLSKKIAVDGTNVDDKAYDLVRHQNYDSKTGVPRPCSSIRAEAECVGVCSWVGTGTMQRCQAKMVGCTCTDIDDQKTCEQDTFCSWNDKAQTCSFDRNVAFEKCSSSISDRISALCNSCGVGDTIMGGDRTSCGALQASLERQIGKCANVKDEQGCAEHFYSDGCFWSSSHKKCKFRPLAFETLDGNLTFKVRPKSMANVMLAQEIVGDGVMENGEDRIGLPQSCRVDVFVDDGSGLSKASSQPFRVCLPVREHAAHSAGLASPSMWAYFCQQHDPKHDTLGEDEEALESAALNVVAPSWQNIKKLK